MDGETDKKQFRKKTKNTQNNEINQIFKLNHVKLRLIIARPKCPTKKLSQLI